MKIDEMKLLTVLRRKSLTQKQLSKNSGISRSTINGIASGRRCSPETAEKIADTLGVKLDELLEKEEG